MLDPHPKHVELSAENIIKLNIVASCWTIIDTGVGVACKTPINFEYRDYRLCESFKLFKVNEFFNQFGVNFNVEKISI